MEIINSVAERVARREGTSPTELRPLYEVIDTDALERVFDSAEEGNVVVEFRYSGYVVTVSGDRSVHLDAKPDAPGRAANP